MFRKKQETNTASKTVIGIGALATGIGRLVGGRVGDGLTGFGLAHIVLGTLDMARPTVRMR